MDPDPPLTETPDALALAALQQRLRRPPVSLLYVAGLGLVTLAMLVLPLVYLAVVGAAGYAVFWHATRGFWWHSPVGGFRIRLLVVLVYLALLVIGLIIVFFLLKPLLARRGRCAQPLALHPGAEPRLYAFIEAISHAVGAPAPRRIDLTCDLNASAGFRRGLWSFLGRDLVLTLGLPLVANLTVAELAGVVAHEFGHFNQGIAMRLHHVVSRVNGWFVRVVYERDAWDDALQDAGDQPEEWSVALIVWTAQLGVGLSRLLLSGLMHVGIALSAFLSRQMEFHADACEYALAGSETTERTTRKFATLAVAMEQAGRLLRDGWRKSHRLPDNLPELLHRVHSGLPPHVIAATDSTLGLERTAWYDTHPCPAERIRQARLAQAPGLLFDDRPASALFERFDVPARQVTELYYTDDLRLPVGPESLVPLDPIHAEPAKGGPVAGVCSHRELTAPPINDSLLLGAPELLLPLPFGGVLIGVEAESEASPAEPVDSGELEVLIQQLESVRPQIAEWAVQASALRPLPFGGRAHVPNASGTGHPQGSGSDSAELRRAAREVVEGTARRLELGLQLAWQGGAASRQPRLLECQSWLRDAYSEFDHWWTLSREAALIAAQPHAVSSRGDSSGVPAQALETRLAALRNLRASLTTRPRTAAPSPGVIPPTTRRLRVGPQAEALRELDALGCEAVVWFETYHQCLSTLWELAGREEARLTSRH
ncbi:MAG: Protease HtpX [Verrucomicrobiota bacterium]